MQNAILFQAYGGIDFIYECKYALLKYLQVYNLNPPAGTGIFIYTDQPHLFADFLPFFEKLECIPLSAYIIKKWRGDSDFVHRAKIEMILDFMNRFEGNVLYCDTDAYAISTLENIFYDIENGSFYMHQYEGLLNKSVSPSFHKWEAFLSSTPVFYNNKKFEFSRAIQIYNAGVVGINSRNKALLFDVLALTDSIYQKFSKHIAEQFAFSYCLQKQGNIKTADQQVAHYWNLKEFRQFLSLFFTRNLEESIPNLVKKIHHIDALTIQKHKSNYKRLPVFKRILKTISGTAWRIGQYEKKV